MLLPFRRRSSPLRRSYCRVGRQSHSHGYKIDGVEEHNDASYSLLKMTCGQLTQQTALFRRFILSHADN